MLFLNIVDAARFAAKGHSLSVVDKRDSRPPGVIVPRGGDAEMFPTVAVALSIRSDQVAGKDDVRIPCIDSIHSIVKQRARKY